MDASVNMKMTPQELRLIRTALETAAAIAHGITNDTGAGPRDRREAREAEAQYKQLLTKT